MAEHRESPTRRVNPSGQVRWVARYTGPDGRRKSAGTFALKRDAQAAINEAYELAQAAPRLRSTVGGFFETWTIRHPRTDRTNKTNEGRINAVLDVDVEGVPLRHMELGALKRRHTLELVDHMLRVQGRAYTGVQGVLRSLSAMAEDAITEDYMDANPFKGVRVRANDPRIRKDRRAVVVWSWEDMHRFAAACGQWEPMVRVLSDCGLRIGELMPLRRRDLDLQAMTLEVRQTAWEGRLLAGTKTDHNQRDAGRVVPVPPGLGELLAAMPKRIDSPWLFPTATGAFWREANWRRDVWYPAQKRTGLFIRPHEMRHSYVSRLRAAGVDPADLADVAGHTVETATSLYTHSLGRSFDAIRRAVGG